MPLNLFEVFLKFYFSMKRNFYSALRICSYVHINTGEKCATLKQSQGLTYFTKMCNVEMFLRWRGLNINKNNFFLSETTLYSSIGQSILCWWCGWYLFLFTMK